MAVLRLFAQARQAAGTAQAEVPGRTVAEVLHAATDRFGPDFAEVLGSCGVWVNGEPAPPDTPVGAGDEVAVLPPVSGGAVETGRPDRRSGKAAPAARPVRRPARRAPEPQRTGRLRRLLPPPDTAGPRVRLGVLWFLLALAAATAGRWWTAALWALVAAVAAVQLVRVWRAAACRPGEGDRDDGGAREALAAVGAVAVVAAAGAGTGLAGLALVVVSVGSYLVAQLLRRPSGAALEVAIGAVLPAVVAGAAVLVVRTELWGGLFLVLAVSFYDAGCFLFGAEARSPWEGPVVGIAGAVAITFTMAAFQPPPFSPAAAWVTGLLMALSCPVGQALVAAALPAGDERVPAVRRLDAYALAAPVMLGALWVIG